MKRIQIDDETFNQLDVLSKELGFKSIKQNENITKLLNAGFVEGYKKKLSELELAKSEIANLKEISSNIDEKQMSRLKKLQTLGIIDNDISQAISALIDCYVEANEEKIKEIALKI